MTNTSDQRDEATSFMVMLTPSKSKRCDSLYRIVPMGDKRNTPMDVTNRCWWSVNGPVFREPIRRGQLEISSSNKRWLSSSDCNTLLPEWLFSTQILFAINRTRHTGLLDSCSIRAVVEYIYMHTGIGVCTRIFIERKRKHNHHHHHRLYERGESERGV